MDFGTRTFPARVESLLTANEFVEGCVDRCGLDAMAKYGVLLALEEAFVNVCCYAYPGGSGTVDVGCSGGDGLFTLELADAGRPFDVLALPEPDTTATLDEREVGGLGIHFIRQFSRSVAYRRESDRNVLRMTFAAAAPTP